jgi:hypothetical protein
MGHPVIPLYMFIDIPAFLVPDYGDRDMVQEPYPPHHCQVVAKTPVPVKLEEIHDHILDIIQGGGPLGMTGQSHDIDRFGLF